MTDRPDTAHIPRVVTVRPWVDPVIDTLGYDVRSVYAERFWLPTLGPTALWLLRHLADRFEESDGAPVQVPLADTSRALGLGPKQGNDSPLARAFERLSQFDLAFAHPDGMVAVRRNIAPVNRRHIRRLPSALQSAHDEWMARSEGHRRLAERRARRSAFVLAELGTDADTIERALLHAGHPPGLCREAAVWASTRHREIERESASERAHPSTQDAA